MSHRSLYRIGRESTGSHITASRPPQRRTRDEVDSDIAAMREGTAERATKGRERLESIPPQDEWGSQ